MIIIDTLSTYIHTYIHTHVGSESESLVRLFANPWTIQSMEFSRPE